MKHVPVVLCLLSACVVPSSDEELSHTEQSLRCSDWMCQTNSPVIDSYGFHELNTQGVANTAGFAITGFSLGTTQLALSVTDGRLIGRRADGTELEGTQLTNAVIQLSLHGHPMYWLRIAHVSEVPLWADSGRIWVTTYLLEWTVVGSKLWTSMCTLPDSDMGMEAYHSVLFEGDRVDAKRKTIDPVAQPHWFNIGCAGSTLAKMYLTAHTYASKAYGYTTTVEQRQTMLKMLSGDYCGRGTAYTVAGTPLDWKDDKGWMNYISSNSQLEARWTASGAKCLNTPRIEASQYAPGLATFPDVASAIANECKIPSCDEAPPNDEFMGFHLLSANP